MHLMLILLWCRKSWTYSEGRKADVSLTFHTIIEIVHVEGGFERSMLPYSSLLCLPIYVVTFQYFLLTVRCHGGLLFFTCQCSAGLSLLFIFQHSGEHIYHVFNIIVITKWQAFHNDVMSMGFYEWLTWLNRKECAWGRFTRYSRSHSQL